MLYSLEKMEIIYSIGDDEGLGIDYLFENPEYSAVDSDGNIYVADKMDMQI